jgi:DNA-directed RNA polymerase specialized sigma24 family protein
MKPTKALRPAEQEALRLVLWDGLTHADAAAVLRCSANAFELRYRWARNAVRDAVVRTCSPADLGSAPTVRTAATPETAS